MEYTTLSRREIYAGRVIHVAVDDVRFDDGAMVTRELVTHPGAVTIVPVLPDGRLVLVLQFRYPAGGEIWEFPAGTLEAAEPPAECAARELVEETGYRAGTLTPLATFYTAPGFCTERMHLFLGTDLTPTTQALDADERLEVHALPAAEVAAMVADGRIADAKTLVGWYRYAAWRAEHDGAPSPAHTARFAD